MATSIRTDEPADSSDSPPPTGDRGRRGHIGLIVLGSIVAGLVLGLVLVIGVFDGSEEATITGAALISLGAGCSSPRCRSRLTWSTGSRPPCQNSPKGSLRAQPSRRHARQAPNSWT